MDDTEGAFATRRGLLKSAVVLPITVASRKVRSAALATEPAEEARNAQIVRSYLQACDAGDVAGMASFVSPDVAWWILGRRQFDARTINQINEKRYPVGGSQRSSIVGIIAEGKRVAVEYETETVTGDTKTYRMYHHLFVVSGGRFTAVNEYLDPPPLDKPFSVSQALAPGAQPWRPADPARESAEQTRAVATAFLAPGPQNLSLDLTAPGFRWWVGGWGYMDFRDYFAKLRTLMAAHPMAPPIKYNKGIIGMTVEPGRVAVEISTDAVFPQYDYVNRFHCAVTVRDGKIVEMHEHTDHSAGARGGIPEVR
jgi:ketosteroid isomerase-like protein